MKNFILLLSKRLIATFKKSKSKVKDLVNKINTKKEIEDTKIIKVMIKFFIKIDKKIIK